MEEPLFVNLRALRGSPSITDQRSGRLALFGLLYFVQGSLFAYVLVFNNLYLRNHGASAEQLGLLNGLLVIPFILKIAIGLWSDKVSLFGRGHRLPYIRLGLLTTATGTILASFIPPVERYGLFLPAALLIAGGLALYDTVTDGLAIDVTPLLEQKLVQGAMVVGRALGLVLLASIYGRLIVTLGWQIVFWVAAVLSLLPFLLLWRVREPAQRPAGQSFDGSAVRQLWRPEIRRFALYAIHYSFIVYGANAIVALFANEGLGGTLVLVGDGAALGGLGMLAGGLAATLIGQRTPIWRQAQWTAVITTVVLLLMALLTTLDNVLYVMALWGICLSATELVFITLAMRKADPRMAAGGFAIFMAISNVGTGLGQATTTSLIDTLDFRWLFGLLAVVNLLAFPVLRGMKSEK